MTIRILFVINVVTNSPHWALTLKKRNVFTGSITSLTDYYDIAINI